MKLLILLFIVFTAPVLASPEVIVDSDGYIRGDSYSPARPPNQPSTVTKGYIDTPHTQDGYASTQDGYVRLKSRTIGNKTVTTGTIGDRTVRIVTEAKVQKD